MFHFSLVLTYLLCPSPFSLCSPNFLLFSSSSCLIFPIFFLSSSLLPYLTSFLSLFFCIFFLFYPLFLLTLHLLSYFPPLSCHSLPSLSLFPPFRRDVKGAAGSSSPPQTSLLLLILNQSPARLQGDHEQHHPQPTPLLLFLLFFTGCRPL